MKLVEDQGAFFARLTVAFVKYFTVLAYALFVLRRFGTLLTALPPIEGVLLLVVSAAGCFFIVKSLDARLASFVAQRKSGRSLI
jgi:hypothetical protein